MMEPKRITPANFAEFGKVALLPDVTPLAQDETFQFWSDVASYEINGETEIGFCTVYGQKRDFVDWMERHDQTPELLVPIDSPFVLPVMTQNGSVDVFRVDLGVAVVIGPGVWHSACKPIGASEATYFVIFRRGTPAEDVEKTSIPPTEIRRHE